MRLTDIAIRRVKLKTKPFRLADGKGLALLVKPNGAKYWQFRYRFANKGKLLSLGVYPETTLAEARERCYEARKQLANGVDPGEVRRLKKFVQLEAAANSFEVVGLEWFSLQKAAWSESHAKRNFWLLEKTCCPGWDAAPSRKSPLPNYWPRCAALKAVAQSIPPSGPNSWLVRFFVMPSQRAASSAIPRRICEERLRQALPRTGPPSPNPRRSARCW